MIEEVMVAFSVLAGFALGWFGGSRHPETVAAQKKAEHSIDEAEEKA